MTGEFNRDRALATFSALRNKAVFNERSCLWGRRKWLVLRANEALWPFADAWSALCTLAALPESGVARSHLGDLPKGLRAYHRHPRSALTGPGPIGFESLAVFPHGRGGDVFYDDNTWLGLALCAHHELTAGAQSAKLSRRLLAFILSGWSNENSWANPGGIRWKVPASCHSRNTCSNAPVIELAALIAATEGGQEYLAWAERIYAWVRTSLLGAEELYWDRNDPDGTVHREIWSYNQGTMIGAGVLLHRATGDDDYLFQAEATANAAISRFSVDELLRQDAAFNAVFFRNLLLLNAVSPNGTYRELAMAYGERMWSERRDASSGLFGGGSSFLNDTAPMVEIYALLAGAPPHP
jgi:hypothetical protein